MKKYKKYIRLGIYFCLFAILIGMFVYLGKKDYGSDVVKYSDNEKFSMEYSDIPVDNGFKYISSYNFSELLKSGTGIVFAGFSSNEWSQYYVKYLYDVLKDKNLTSLYYYDALKDRSRQSKYYLLVEDLLSDYLYRNDKGNISLDTPAVIFIKDGNVVHFDDETAITRNNVSPSDYWTEDRISAFEIKINSYLDGEDFNG